MGKVAGQAVVLDLAHLGAVVLPHVLGLRVVAEAAHPAALALEGSVSLGPVLVLELVAGHAVPCAHGAMEERPGLSLAGAQHIFVTGRAEGVAGSTQEL